MNIPLNKKITLILPIKINVYGLGSDLERAKRVLLPSLVKFFDKDSIEEILVFSPKNEVDEARRQLAMFESSLNLSVWNEEDVLARIPEWRNHIALMNKLYLFRYIAWRCSVNIFRDLGLESWFFTHGWQRNMIIKLLAAVIVRTNYYMCLDADVCLTRPADMKILFPEGKAIYQSERLKEHYSWWRASAGILRQPLELDGNDYGLSVTPQILAKAVVLDLIEHLRIVTRLKNNRTLLELLCSDRGWTEYTLYWLHLLKRFKKEDFYSEDKSISINHCDNNIWNLKSISSYEEIKERIEKAFKNPSALFLIIQSSSMQTERVIDLFKAYL